MPTDEPIRAAMPERLFCQNPSERAETGPVKRADHNGCIQRDASASPHASGLTVQNVSEALAMPPACPFPGLLPRAGEALERMRPGTVRRPGALRGEAAIERRGAEPRDQHAA